MLRAFSIFFIFLSLSPSPTSACFNLSVVFALPILIALFTLSRRALCPLSVAVSVALSVPIFLALWVPFFVEVLLALYVPGFVEVFFELCVLPFVEVLLALWVPITSVTGVRTWPRTEDLNIRHIGVVDGCLQFIACL